MAKAAARAVERDVARDKVRAKVRARAEEMMMSVHEAKEKVRARARANLKKKEREKAKVKVRAKAKMKKIEAGARGKERAKEKVKTSQKEAKVARRAAKERALGRMSIQLLERERVVRMLVRAKAARERAPATTTGVLHVTLATDPATITMTTLHVERVPAKAARAAERVARVARALARALARAVAGIRHITLRPLSATLPLVAMMNRLCLNSTIRIAI